MSASRAAWLLEKRARPFKVDAMPMPQPKEREVLIRTHTIAINPVDAGIQATGMIWQDYPLVIGCDVAGEVVSVGSSVSNFKPGDRVIALLERGAFAEHCVQDVSLVAKLPDNVSYNEGAVVPLALITAAVSLFHPVNLALDLPSLTPKSNGKIVVVWGGSSSVGACGLQMVKAAGYEVVTTASARNEQFCKDIGADYFVDHRKDNAVDTIVDMVKRSGKEYAGIFSAIMVNEVIKTCTEVAGRLGKDAKSRVVATVLAPGMPYEYPLPEGVRLSTCACTIDILPNSPMASFFGMELRPNEIGPKVWDEWLTPAMAKGLMKCKPDPEVAGRGLESVQAACDEWAAGVSAKKLVVEIV